MAKILSVDDSMVMRRIIRGAVEVLGYTFLEAGDGAAAFEVLAREWQDIALILLNVNMPGMNGLEVLEKIKASDVYRHIPVMMVTTESERVQVVRAIKAGAANYVCKPFTPEELTTKMVESLGLTLEL
jgi:two-component system chemotaxis response regulator CheY